MQPVVLTRAVCSRAAEEPPEEVEPPKLPEIMRLAVLVNKLDAENAIAPAGALCMVGTGAVKENSAYAGAPPRPTRARRRPRAQPCRPAALPRPASARASPTRASPTRASPTRAAVARAGLSSAAAGSISSYVFANQLKAKDVLQPAMTNSLDFLAPADGVVPKGALCAHLDESTGVSTILRTPDPHPNPDSNPNPNLTLT